MSYKYKKKLKKKKEKREDELQDWCMFHPKRMAGWTAWIYFYKQSDYLRLVPAQIDLHENIEATANQAS